MAEELKACPFCGGDAESRLFDAQYFVQCVKCFNSTAADQDLESSAIAAWNTRTQLPSQGGEAVALTVWCGPMPESNGKSNFTAVLMRKGASLFDGLTGGITIERSEYPDRVRYEADRMRYLIGELDAEPDILAYDPDRHSGYTHPAAQMAEPDAELVALLHDARLQLYQAYISREDEEELQQMIKRIDAKLASLKGAP